MAKPRIAILHYSGPPVIGGVEFIIRAHAKQFSQAGFDTRLIVGKGGSIDDGIKTVIVPEIASRGGPLARILTELSHGNVPKTFDNAVKRVERKLAAALKDVDVCMMHNVLTMHFNLVLTAALANIMRRNRTVHFVGWTHDLTFSDPLYEPHQHRRYPWSLLLQPLPGCDYCAISKQRQIEMRKIFRLPARRLPVIPDGIDVPGLLDLTPLARRLFEEEGLATVDMVALTPARILRRKNFGVGMEIVAALKRQGYSVRWIISGAPDPHNAESMRYYRMLRSLRRKLKIEKDVIFLSERVKERVSSRDLHSLYSIADMLLFPSDREGFGLPVLEAGVHGLIVCINDIPALRELGGNEAVYIHLGDSSDMIARKIIKAMRKRPELLYRKKVISSYAWDVIFRDYLHPVVMRPQTVWTDRAAIAHERGGVRRRTKKNGPV